MTLTINMAKGLNIKKALISNRPVVVGLSYRGYDHHGAWDTSAVVNIVSEDQRTTVFRTASGSLYSTVVMPTIELLFNSMYKRVEVEFDNKWVIVNRLETTSKTGYDWLIVAESKGQTLYWQWHVGQTPVRIS